MDKELIGLLQRLIQIDSQNPIKDEREIILFIKSYLDKLGILSKVYEFKKNHPNLVCRLKSTNSKRTIILTPHVDTVPATGIWRFGPFSGKIHQGKIYGRGATDCKVNVAVSLYLIKKLKEKNIVLKNLDLLFAFCADEETGSYYGTIPLMKKLRGIDYGVVLDADEFNIVVAQKGLLHLRVELLGREAHGAYPDRGINAISKGVRILNEILNYKFTCKNHALLKKPTLNIGRFGGGDKVNIVAGYAFFELDFRYIPGLTKEKIIAAVTKIIQKHQIKFRLKILAEQTPIEINKNSFLIRNLKKVLTANQIMPKIVPSFGATVINFLKDRGIETFAFGFGTKKCAHIKNEYVKIGNLDKGVKVLEEYVCRLDEYLDNLNSNKI